MPDDNAPDQVSGGVGETPDEQSQQGAQSADDGLQLDGEFNAERALRTIRTLRQEAKGAKAHLRELEQLRQEKQQRDQERMSEQEKLTTRAQQLEAELRYAQQERQDRELDWAIERAASKAGCADPEAARLLLRQGDLLDFDDDGKPKDVERALKTLLKERPWLAGSPNGGPPTSVGNPATRASGPGQRTYTRADLADHQTYLKNRDDIMAAYRENRITD